MKRYKNIGKDVVSVGSDKITIVRSCAGRQLTEDQINVLKNNWKKVDYNGYLSVETSRKIKAMLTTWADAIQVANEKNKNSKGLKKEDYGF